NSASPLLPLPTRGRLASRAPPSHLLGARRFHCFCHRKQNNGRVEPEIPAPATIASAGDALSSHEMERNPGLAAPLRGPNDGVHFKPAEHDHLRSEEHTSELQ